GAADFAGVERKPLLLGHLDRNRLEIFEEAAAAERLPADPQPAEHLAFIPHADLAQLDPGMEVGGKILDKLTEIDPVIGREIEDEFVAVKGIFRINELHLKLV